MTQTNIPAWCQALQAKLMAALDAAWAILEHSDDPAEIRRARDKAKACGEIAAMARKVALIGPTPRAAPAPVPHMPAATSAAIAPTLATIVPPVAAQAEHARRAFEKLKGGRRGRL
jgi:hypothetical protein